ncbi:DNRLRE domain-containing protein [Myxococcus sp. AB056]|uniref:CBM96 family carbohydrate-binding protein n=1 Tax=Myxococcus sp. AB056 TaxID=2562792 RepID=UPI001E2C9B29|nr:DNRLRE domain-containing protein [Myxococcus sp. AB056]
MIVKQWRKGLGLLPILGMAVGCGGVVAEESGEQQAQTAAVKVQALPPGCEDLGREYNSTARRAGDTYVVQGAPDTPHNTSTVLISDGNPRQETYLRFRVDAAASTTVIQAELRLHALDGSSNGPAVYATSADWDPYSLTWNNRPALVGAPLANVGPIASGTFVTYDVTAHVTGNGLYSFALVPEVGDGTDFASTRHPTYGLGPELRLRLRETEPRCQHRGTGGAVTQVLRGDTLPRDLAMDGSGGFATLATYSTDTGSGMRLTRYDANGSVVWMQNYPENNGGWRTLGGLVMTPLGNLLVHGSFTGPLDFGTGPLPGTGPGNHGLFIAKFSPTGQFVWGKAFRAFTHEQGMTTPAPIWAHGIATDANGSLIVTGDFQGRTDLGGGPLDAGPSSHTTVGRRGMFLAKFSWEGTHLWSHAFAAGNDWDTLGLAVATDSQGHILVGGTTSGVNDLGSSTWMTPFIARFLPTGERHWVRRLEGARGNITGVAAMPDGAVAFRGDVRGTFTFAGTSLTNPNEDPDMVLGVLESSSTDRWARLYGGVHGEYGGDLVVDAQGNLVTSGVFSYETDLGGGTLNPDQAGEESSFVASYGPDGSHRWSRAVGDGLAPTLLGLTPSREVFFGGLLEESEVIRVDQTEYSSEGGFTLLLRLSP